MIYLAVLIRAKPGLVEKVRANLQGIIAPSRAEPGNLLYNVHVSADDPHIFVMYQCWTSRQALAEHFATPHMQALVGDGSLLVGPPEGHILEPPLDPA